MFGQKFGGTIDYILSQDDFLNCKVAGPRFFVHKGPCTNHVDHFLDWKFQDFPLFPLIFSVFEKIVTKE